jgi:hypothetical protein
MPPRKNGLPADRHREIGLELARMRDRLIALTGEISGAYPKNSRAGRLAARTEDPIDRLRIEMENRWFAENPDATASPWFPSAELRGTSHRPQIVGHMPFHDMDLWCCAAHAEEAGSR